MTEIPPEVSEQLLPCPFCGHKRFYWYQTKLVDNVSIGCETCGAMGPIAQHTGRKDDNPWGRAINLWNKKGAWYDPDERSV